VREEAKKHGRIIQERENENIEADQNIEVKKKNDVIFH
jgi:hypothetical protein